MVSLFNNEIMPGSALISADGKRIVTVDDWYNQDYQKPGIVIYDASGTVLKRLHVKDILSPQELEEIKPSEGDINWPPWKIDVFLMVHSNEIQVLRDRIAKGPGKKYDNLFIDLKTFKISKEKLD